MDDYDKRLREGALMVTAAREIDSPQETLRALTELAALMIEGDKKGEAANLLAFVLHYPDVRYDIYDRADDLFILLEAELCPRVIQDARDLASSTTLRGAVENALAAL